MAFTSVPAVTDGDDLLDDWGNAVADFNAEVIDVFDDTLTTWSSPIVGGITVGSGTTTARYCQIGPVTFCMFRFLFAADSSVTGSVTLDLPVDSAFQVTVSGTGIAFDTSLTAAWALNMVQAANTTQVVFRTTGTTPLSSTAPFTWATGDLLSAQFSYFHA